MSTVPIDVATVLQPPFVTLDTQTGRYGGPIIEALNAAVSFANALRLLGSDTLLAQYYLAPVSTAAGAAVEVIAERANAAAGFITPAAALSVGTTSSLLASLPAPAAGPLTSPVDMLAGKLTFSYPIAEAGVRMLSPRFAPAASAWSLFQPFSYTTWLIVIAMLIVCSLSIWAMDKYSPIGARARAGKQSKGRREVSCPNSLYMAIIFSFGKEHEPPRAWSSRGAAVAMLLASFFLLADYDAALAAQSAVRNMAGEQGGASGSTGPLFGAPAFRSLYDLQQSGAGFAVVSNSSADTLITAGKQRAEPLLQQLYPRMQRFPDLASALEAFRRGLQDSGFVRVESSGYSLVSSPSQLKLTGNTVAAVLDSGLLLEQAAAQPPCWSVVAGPYLTQQQLVFPFSLGTSNSVVARAINVGLSRVAQEGSALQGIATAIHAQGRSCPSSEEELLVAEAAAAGSLSAAGDTAIPAMVEGSQSSYWRGVFYLWLLILGSAWVVFAVELLVYRPDEGGQAAPALLRKANKWLSQGGAGGAGAGAGAGGAGASEGYLETDSETRKRLQKLQQQKRGGAAGTGRRGDAAQDDDEDEEDDDGATGRGKGKAGLRGRGKGRNRGPLGDIGGYASKVRGGGAAGRDGVSVQGLDGNSFSNPLQGGRGRAAAGGQQGRVSTPEEKRAKKERMTALAAAAAAASGKRGAAGAGSSSSSAGDLEEGGLGKGGVFGVTAAAVLGEEYNPLAPVLHASGPLAADEDDWSEYDYSDDDEEQQEGYEGEEYYQDEEEEEEEYDEDEEDDDEDEEDDDEEGEEDDDEEEDEEGFYDEEDEEDEPEELDEEEEEQQQQRKTYNAGGQGSRAPAAAAASQLNSVVGASNPLAAGRLGPSRTSSQTATAAATAAASGRGVSNTDFGIELPGRRKN